MRATGTKIVYRLALIAACAGLVTGLVTGCKAKKEATPAAPAPGEATTDMTVPLPALMDPATVLVEVDGAKLTAGDVDAQVNKMVANSERKVSPDQLAQLMPRLRQQASEQFVVRTLLKNEAARQNIAVSEDDIKKATDEISARLPDGMTLEDAMQKDGISQEQFRTNLIEELKVKKLVEAQVPTNVMPTAEDIAAFYETQRDRFTQPESVEARHILLKVAETDKEDVRAEKRAKADALRQQLVEGADFEKLAKENSDCPSKDNGGNLGTFSRGQMVKAFEDAAFTQATNEIGPVIETQFGYHIVQVLNHNAPKTIALDEVRSRISDFLKQRKQVEAFETYLATLKGKSQIVYGEGIQAPPGDMTPPGAR